MGPLWDPEGKRTVALDAMPLQAAHIAEAGLLYGAAFRDDPFVQAALVGLDGDTRQRCLAEFFAANASACVKRGLPWEFRDEDRMVAVLIAYPPGGYPPPLLQQARVFLSSLWRIRFLGRKLPVCASRLLTFWNELAKVHPTQPHYYTEYLAVKPGYQGHGVATLFGSTLAPTADRARIGVYLETPNPRTVPLYERFGFRLLGEKDILGVRFALMWRDPQPTAQAGG